METMKVEVETNSEGREDVELEGDDWGHKRDGRDHISYWRETGPQIEILQLMISNSEGREDVELVWDDWGHERDVRDHTGDGWDHVEAVVVVGESTKSDKLTAADSWTDEALPVGWRNPIFLVESYRFTEVVSWKDKALN